MIRAVRQKKRRKRHLYFVGLLVIWLAAAGGIMHRLSLSPQDVIRIIQLAVGKVTNTREDVWSKDSILRGVIYDRNFEELSVSYQLFTLYVHVAELADRHSTAEKLALILGMDKEILVDRLKNVKPVIAIADDLDKQQVADITLLGLDGVYCKPVEKRFYPFHETAAHLLGFIGNNTGLAGVEALYDPVLQPGVFRDSDVSEVDFNDSEAFGRTTTDVILTIDINWQKKVEQQLRDYREVKGAARGVALVMEPASGRVLAMASQPGFDPNCFWKAETQELQDLVFMANFERDLVRPVLVTAAAIYEAGLDGEILPVGVRAPDYGLAEEKLADYWELFDFQLPVQPILPSSGKLAQQNGVEGVKTTRLSGAQLEVGLASLLNGGSRIRPYFLHSLYDHYQDRVYSSNNDTIQRERVIPPVDGVNLRRELMLHSPYSSKDGFLFFNRNINISENQGLSDYRIQEVLLAAVPRKTPNVLLLMAVDYGILYPLPNAAVKTKNNNKNLVAVGRDLLPVLVGYAKPEQDVAKYPVNRSEDNYRRFLISRRLELPEQKKNVSDIEKIMPEVTGLSLRKGLQQISPYHLKVSVKGSGRIIGRALLLVSLLLKQESVN